MLSPIYLSNLYLSDYLSRQYFLVSSIYLNLIILLESQSLIFSNLLALLWEIFTLTSTLLPRVIPYLLLFKLLKSNIDYNNTSTSISHSKYYFSQYSFYLMIVFYSISSILYPIYSSVIPLLSILGIIVYSLLTKVSQMVLNS